MEYIGTILIVLGISLWRRTEQFYSKVVNVNEPLTEVMKKLELYQVDAFTDRLFGGNPACVVPLDNWLDDDILLKIAEENAVAETAYFIVQEDRVLLRWFTPNIEMDLCGHATLATAHVLKKHKNYPHDTIVFDTAVGELTVEVQGSNYAMDFPARSPIKADMLDVIRNSVNIEPIQVFKARDYILVYNSEEDIRKIIINRHTFDKINLNPGGLVVTAPGEDCDFVSRFFTPQSTILEDPVTGSSHCSLIPYWSDRLGKKDLSARQLSKRGGVLTCQDLGERVLISGQARTYSEGFVWIDTDI